jgi:hypothetical protein
MVDERVCVTEVDLGLSSSRATKLKFRMVNRRRPLAEPKRVPISLYTIQQIYQETEMKFALIGAAALMAAASVTPALAQAVIEDPGYCAQFYPNANCQNLGPGNPYTDGGYYGNDWRNGNAFVERHWQRHHVTRHR